MKKLIYYAITLVLVLLLSSFILINSSIVDSNITTIELLPPPIDLNDVNRIWKKLKKEIGAPDDLPAPIITLDWEVPIYARMGTQYPTEEFPNNRLQISIAPRTIDSEPDYMVLFGIGHEMVHYLFILRENGYKIQKLYVVELHHHCNPEFQDFTRVVIDEVWNIYHVNKNIMNDEIVKSCSNYSGQ